MKLVGRFLNSRIGLIAYLVLAATISAGVGASVYSLSLKDTLAHKADETATTIRLVDAFVTTYARMWSHFGNEAPVPATFRAHSIERFNTQSSLAETFVLHWVGRQGRQIKSPPISAEVAAIMEAFATTADHKPRTVFVMVDGRQVLRTIYPSLASEPGCVNCHNRIQANKFQWRLNDVMGAFVIDMRAASFMANIKAQGYAVGIILFIVLAGIGLAVPVHSRQMEKQEAAAAHMRTQNIRFITTLNNMTQGVSMFDSDNRLVVHNPRYAQMYALPPELLKSGPSVEEIVRHRVTNGILAGSTSNDAVAAKLTELSKHSADAVSSRLDRLADGRLIKILRTPMPDGGWVATHEDVTEQTQRASVDAAIADFRERVAGMLKTVRDSTKAMKSTASELFGSSEQTSQRARGILQASQVAATSVENAAAATQQMSCAAAEIGHQIEMTTKVVRSAVNQVHSTSAEFSGLSTAAQKIGDVIHLIQKISGQTNLLALNATIEAARAGEAGRGFAVVASEVKSLALQTNQATEEVAGQIAAVQSSTSGVVQAVGSIGKCINEISTYASGVAGSIEEQGAATQEISNNVANASRETSKIVAALNEVTDAATATRTSAEIVLSASKSVEGAVDNLHQEIETFLGNVAA
jgi:methyl-accepting chemotaxis protein